MLLGTQKGGKSRKYNHPNLSGLTAGVYRTMDGGATWSIHSTGLDPITPVPVTVDPQSPQTVYTGTFGGGVFKTN